MKYLQGPAGANCGVGMVSAVGLHMKLVLGRFLLGEVAVIPTTSFLTRNRLIKYKKCSCEHFLALRMLIFFYIQNPLSQGYPKQSDFLCTDHFEIFPLFDTLQRFVYVEIRLSRRKSRRVVRRDAPVSRDSSKLRRTVSQDS